MRIQKIMTGRRRPLTVAGVVAATAAGVVGAAGASAAATQHSKARPASAQPTVAFVCATGSQQPFFVPIQRGAQAAAKAYGVHLSYTGLTQPNAFTAPIITNALKIAVDQKPQALVVCDFFPSSENPLIKKARNEGIPVFISNSSSPASQGLAVASFLEGNYEAGVQAGKTMAKEGVKTAVCVNDNPGEPSVNQRCSGFVAGGKAAGMKVSVDTLPQGDSSDATLEANAVKGELASHPSVGGVLMMGPVQGPAAVQGVQEAGRSGKVEVGTFDLSASVLNDVKNGSIAFGIWQEPYLEGYMPVEAAANYVKYGMSPTGSVGTGPVFVTKANVDKVKKETATYGG